jgi:hypothetical protein
VPIGPDAVKCRDAVIAEYSAVVQEPRDIAVRDELLKELFVEASGM